MAKVIQDVPYEIYSKKSDRLPHETFASFKVKRTNAIFLCLCFRLLGGNYSKFDRGQVPRLMSRNLVSRVYLVDK